MSLSKEEEAVNKAGGKARDEYRRTHYPYADRWGVRRHAIRAQRRQERRRIEREAKAKRAGL